MAKKAVSREEQKRRLQDKLKATANRLKKLKKEEIEEKHVAEEREAKQMASVCKSFGFTTPDALRGFFESLKGNKATKGVLESFSRGSASSEQEDAS